MTRLGPSRIILGIEIDDQGESGEDGTGPSAVIGLSHIVDAVESVEVQVSFWFSVNPLDSIVWVDYLYSRYVIPVLLQSFANLWYTFYVT